MIIFGAIGNFLGQKPAAKKEKIFVVFIKRKNGTHSV